MNSSIASKRLAPVAAELLKRVPFYPDETTFNYVNRIVCLTAATHRKHVVATLFGSPTIHTERPCHCGFGHLAALHADAYGAMPSDLPLRLGMLALYAPFVDAERFRRALDLIHGTQFNGANEILGRRSSVVFRDRPAFCPECLKEDVSSRRTPYYRRVHQISAVLCCPNHGVPLISTCCACGSGQSHERRPMLNCRHCGASLEREAPHLEGGSRASLQWRLAKSVQAAMNGTLPGVDAGIRLGTLRGRVARDIKTRSGTVGDNLARTLTEAYGHQFLDSLGLPTDSLPTLAWPALFLQGRLFAAKPIANCLVMALLFESVEDYASEINDAVRRGVQQPLGRNSLTSATRVTMTVLKDLLRPMSIEDVAKKHSIDPGDLKRWVAAVPGLAKRRADSGARVTLRNCKKIILQRLERQPDYSRTGADSQQKREVAIVRMYDPAWLDRYLPSKRGKPQPALNM